ncbi:septum formation family protein [Varibaculum cambriense]|uniref:septum formation family protein n=1 Tax=Varibaculum cambriense TaxID=184870 RepID=UPI0029038C8E|nr:septum formation family protein [Varibaculum cambriense]MDU1224522.1 septum formation family protein [Varibaculum cambriense]
MNAFSFPRFRQLLTVLCALLVACCGFLSGCTSQPVATSDLKVGDCFNMPEEVLTGTQPAGQVERVDCEHSHNSQVVGIKKLSGNSYPGEKQLYELALTECAREFESFVGTSFRDSKWDLYPLSPTETTWKDEGERKLTCVALSLPEQKGSLQDSGK